MQCPGVSKNGPHNPFSWLPFRLFGYRGNCLAHQGVRVGRQRLDDRRLADRGLKAQHLGDVQPYPPLLVSAQVAQERCHRRVEALGFGEPIAPPKQGIADRVVCKLQPPNLLPLLRRDLAKP